MNRALFFFLLSILPLVSACHSPSANGQAAFSMMARWSGADAGGDIAQTRIVRTAADWDAFWKQVGRERPRPLNPAREMAVIISLGEKRSGGFGAEVLAARVANGKLVVDYRETSPAPGSMVTQALTAPWAAVLLPRSDLPVVANRIASDQPGLREK